MTAHQASERLAQMSSSSQQTGAIYTWVKQGVLQKSEFEKLLTYREQRAHAEATCQRK